MSTQHTQKNAFKTAMNDVFFDIESKKMNKNTSNNSSQDSKKEYKRKFPKANNSDSVIDWLENSTDSLHQDYNFFYVYNEFVDDLGLSIQEYLILYAIYLLCEHQNSNTIRLSRAKIATMLCMSIDTVNKYIPKLKEHFFHSDKKNYIPKVFITAAKERKTIKNTFGNGTFEVDGVSYKKGFYSEVITLNSDFIDALNELHRKNKLNADYVQRVLLVPALCKKLAIPDKKGVLQPLKISQLYKLACIDTHERINKQGITQKAEFARKWGISRQNLYTKDFKKRFKGNLVGDFMYRNEKDFEEEKAIIKIADSYKEEEYYFWEERKIYLPHKKSTNYKSKKIMELWAMHTSQMETCLQKSNSLTELITNVVDNEFGFLYPETGKKDIKKSLYKIADLQASKDNLLTEIFNRFSAKNEKYYSKITDFELFEKDLKFCLDKQLLESLKEKFNFVNNEGNYLETKLEESFAKSSNDSFNDLIQRISAFENPKKELISLFEKFVLAYKESVERILRE